MWTTKKIEKVKELAKAEFDIAYIAKEMNKSEKQIYYVIRRYNINIKRKAKVFAMYKGECLLAIGTVKEIAEKLGYKLNSLEVIKSRAKTYRNKYKDDFCFILIED